MLRVYKHLYDKQIVVEDILNYNGSGHVARCLGDGDGYYSVIWLDKTIHKQPIYTEIQDRVIVDFTSKVSNHVLILGGGGCAMSRFFLLEYPNVEVTTIELSSTIIDIAKQYFLADLHQSETDRHSLINAKAFDFVKTDRDNKYDFVFVDIFKGDKLDESIFTEDFSRELMRITTDNAIIAYNLSVFHDKNTLKDIIFKWKEIYKSQSVEINQTATYHYAFLRKNTSPNTKWKMQAKPSRKRSPKSAASLKG